MRARFAEAQQEGLSEQDIDQISHPERSNLPEHEKQALLFAEVYLTSPESITAEFFEDMKGYFSEGQLVEIMFFVGFYNMLQRFNTAIDLQPASEGVTVHSLAVYGSDRDWPASSD